MPNEILPITQYLRNLDLSNNKIKQLPTQLFTKTQILKTLNLSNNKIEFIPDEISLLIKLETVNLSENLLQALPLSISQLKNLKQINLSKNNFKSIPKELGQIKLLDHLDLSGNRIDKIEDYIENLSCIEINLNENQIKLISSSISKCPRLKVNKIISFKRRFMNVLNIIPMVKHLFLFSLLAFSIFLDPILFFIRERIINNNKNIPLNFF